MSADQLFDTSSPQDAPNHVKPEEGRCNVCGMDADRCDGVPANVMERMRRFIRWYAQDVDDGWTFAKTMADIPHSYAVRAKAARLTWLKERIDGLLLKVRGEDEFVWMAQAIRQYGYKRSFARSSKKRFSYVNVDGWRYWTMGNPIAVTTILNRAPLTREGVEELRRENGLTNVRWFECEHGHRFGLVIETFEGPMARTPGEALGCPACGPNHADCVEVDGP